jgi:hypothetical protein
MELQKENADSNTNGLANNSGTISPDGLATIKTEEGAEYVAHLPTTHQAHIR